MPVDDDDPAMADDAGSGWAEDMSMAYDEHLVPPVFRPYAADLASRVVRHRPRAVLELAAGTGVLTHAIALGLPTAHVTATDLSAAMVAVGSANVRVATWRQADAMQLPFDDSSFDLVACQFGVMFFPDRPAGYAEVARVLRPGGTSCSAAGGRWPRTTSRRWSWQPSLRPSPRIHRPFSHGYHDVDRVTADLTTAGFQGIRVVTVELDCRARDASSLARGYCRGTPLRAEIEARGDLETTTLAVTDALRHRFGPGDVVGRMAALVVTAGEALERP